MSQIQHSLPISGFQPALWMVKFDCELAKKPQNLMTGPQDPELLLNALRSLIRHFARGL
jgi:hypothetical protein